MFRFFEPLQKKLRLELTCMAVGPNSEHPVQVEIGGNIRTFSPTRSLATHYMDFGLDRAERTIKFTPPFPTSPASLDDRDRDRRRLGIGFVELTVISDEPAAVVHSGLSEPRIPRRTSSEEAVVWDGIYSKEDPWGYKAEIIRGLTASDPACQ